MSYTVVIDHRAIVDVQEAINYYDDQQQGLGKRFEAELNKYLTALEQNPFFSLRYSNVHCLPLKKFPFMIHYTIDEQNLLIAVYAVFHTSLDPGKWKEREIK